MWYIVNIHLWYIVNITFIYHFYDSAIVSVGGTYFLISLSTESKAKTIIAQFIGQLE